MSRYTAEGRKAYLSGESLDDNPYLYPFFKKQNRKWKEGYLNAAEKVRSGEVLGIPNAGKPIDQG